MSTGRRTTGISRPRLEEMLTALLADGLRLVAPVRQGDQVLFAPVGSPAGIEFDHPNTDLPPKEYFLPRTETVLSYEGTGAEVALTAAEPPFPETVLLGVRPCDAAGIERLRRVFADGVRDDFVLARLEHTTVITVACTEPQPWCFCTGVGGGPAGTEGSDLLLLPQGEGEWLVAAHTAKGEALMDRFVDLLEGVVAAPEATAVAEARARLGRFAPLGGRATDLAHSFTDERWSELGRACLGCGVCAYCCPTCHCFDLTDEGRPGGGRRIKTWDCCAFAGFTVHASGHNPRPAQHDRFRQRVLHKLSYYPDRHQQLMCVGCGRCIRLCPVGQDIYEVALAASGGGEG